MTRVDEQVTVWVAGDGRPLRIEWRTERFTVSDTPTRIGAVSDSVLGFVTHPPRFSVGWRFQGTAGNGASHIFDIGRDSTDGLWKLLRTYD
jgi:hypothetical protein